GLWAETPRDQGHLPRPARVGRGPAHPGPPSHVNVTGIARLSRRFRRFQEDAKDTARLPWQGGDNRYCRLWGRNKSGPAGVLFYRPDSPPARHAAWGNESCSTRRGAIICSMLSTPAPPLTRRVAVIHSHR